MLLRHTSAEIKERSALVVNPAKTCQPIGAMYASLGIHGCLPHSHGSQGCCAYHRSTLSRHYKEPIMAGTSSFTEGSAVFGGQSNLLEAIQNIFALYNPEVIAVHTTCLSETIGDDIPQIVAKARENGKIPPGKYVIHANTPSYLGSHVTGFSNMTRMMVEYFATSSGKPRRQLNVIPGWVEPADMREIKGLLQSMGVSSIVFPDTSGVLDAPQTGHHVFYPKGGVTVSQLKKTGDSQGTLALGAVASEAAAEALDVRCKIPYQALDLPIGLAATDRFIDAIRIMASVPVHGDITEERGQLLDFIMDTQQYFYGKRAALFGDPDQLISLAEFLVTLGMKPVYVVTGTSGKRFEKRIREILDLVAPEARVKQGGDMYLLHQWIKNEPVDLLIGNTYGKYIARDEDIPFLRHGFPILDRMGHSYFPTVGYRGAMRLVEKILGLLQDRKDRDAPEESVELVL